MDRLSPLDATLLHMEDAEQTAHMHIASIGIFDATDTEQGEGLRGELR